MIWKIQSFGYKTKREAEKRAKQLKKRVNNSPDPDFWDGDKIVTKTADMDSK